LGQAPGREGRLKAGKTAADARQESAFCAAPLSRVEISVCPGSGNPYKRPDFPPIPIIYGPFSLAG